MTEASRQASTGNAIAVASLVVSAVGNIAFIWWIMQQNKTIAQQRVTIKALGGA